LGSPYYFESTTYWSLGDEDAHFRWLDSIGCVRGVRGERRKVFLEIDGGAVTEDDLRELKAVYRRYGGDLAQLDALVGANR
jgi:hypothetical protein